MSTNDQKEGDIITESKGNDNENHEAFINDLVNEITVEDSITVKWEDVPDIPSYHQAKSNKAKQLRKATPHIRDNGDEKELKETDKQYKTNAQHAGSQAILAGLGLYAADLAIDVAVFNLAVGSLATELALGATFGVAGLAAVGAYYGGKKMWNWYKESNQADKNKLIRQYNDKLKDMQRSVEKTKKLGKDIRKKIDELSKQEQILNNAVFKKERSDKNGKVILVIGPTGWGKSVLCNRLLGATMDVEDLEDNALYRVAGSLKRCTISLGKETKHVSLYGMNKSLKHAFDLSVIDSPGQFDTENNDVAGFELLREYFHGCGGVNIFCIVFKFGERMNSNYQELLKLYGKFWGKQFWKRCVFIITYCDRDSTKNIKKLDKKLKDNIAAFRERIYTISNEECVGAQIFEFGEENFKKSVKDIMLLINENKYKKKFICENIKSPIDDLWKSINTQITALKKVIENQAKMAKELQDLKKKIESY